MELTVAPDGTIFWIELDGKLKTVNPQSLAVSEVGELKITTVQENGLLGIALDPKFAENGWIYLQYSPLEYPGQHISRFTLKDGKLDLASEKLLLKFEEQRKECCHHAGSMQFGPRGELFIATGDNTHPHGDSQGYAPIDERPERAPWDAQKSSANTNSYSGKILRIKPTPDGGYEIPEGNLFAKDGTQGKPEIYVMGCRNPWRMTVDSQTGYVYWGEVGPDAGGDGPRGPRGYDEINQARKAGNFGWPYFIANNQAYTDVDFSNNKLGEKFNPQSPLNESLNNNGAKHLPPAQPALIYYPYSDSVEFPELGKGGRTACAGPVYHFSAELNSDTKFPAEYDRALLIYEWTRNWIKVVHLDSQGNVKRIEPFMPQQSFVRPIDMEFGPNGSLYMIEYGDSWGVNQNARLIRIDYARGNRAPIAVAAAENNIGKQPLAVKFSSAGSFDKDAGDKLSYSWRVLRANEPVAKPQEISQDPNPTVNFDQPGVYNVELVVADQHRLQRAASVAVLVGNERPVVKFLEPRMGDFFDAAQPINFRMYVNDAEDGTSDFDEADAKDLEPIDPGAVSRLSVNAMFIPGAMPLAGKETDVSQGPEGMRMMKRSDCFNCHAVDQKRVGPPLLEIATKYRGQKDAFEASVQRVLKGSTGVWGKIPMIPHNQHTIEEVREMVRWVYSLEPNGLLRVFPGFAGSIPVSKEEASKPGYYRLEAAYLDRGAGDVPALNGSSTVLLRPRLVEAESADEIRGPQVLGGKSSQEKFIGGINHDHSLRFADINLERVKHLKLSLASAGAGGAIEIRLDKVDGPLLGTVPVEVNGDWQTWYERTLAIPATAGVHDVFIRFTHPNKAGGLMNLDTIYFDAK
jgi:cytochrome c